MAEYGDDWSDAELEICIQQYADVVRRGGTEKNISKDTFISRAKNQLPGRTRDSVLLRMGNLSAVLMTHERPIVLGWAVKKNVGSGIVPRIETLLAKYDLI